jgi:hypothetical protein
MLALLFLGVELSSNAVESHVCFLLSGVAKQGISA